LIASYIKFEKYSDNWYLSYLRKYFINDTLNIIIEYYN